MKLKIGKIQGILEKNSILLNKLKEFSEKLKEFSEKLKVLPTSLGFYCRKTSKKSLSNHVFNFQTVCFSLVYREKAEKIMFRFIVARPEEDAT